MGQVMKSYLGIFFLLVMGLVGIGIVAAGMEANAARNYHADVVTEIECSNFSPAVIHACKAQAQEAGYDFLIPPCSSEQALTIHPCFRITSIAPEKPA